MADKKIEVFYRDVQYESDYMHKEKIRPFWFNYNIIKDNFTKTINRHLSGLTIVNDVKRMPIDYIGLTSMMLEEGESEYQIRQGSDQGAFLELMKILEEIGFKSDQIIYIVENDYLHRPGWCEILLEGFEHGDYVTLYDHPDKYTDYTDLQSKIFVTKSCHWRTIPSTTNTFAVKYGILMEDMELHKYYAEFGIQGLAHDHTKFLDLGKKGRKIISSIPGYSTHCNNYLSPCTDWQKIIKK